MSATLERPVSGPRGRTAVRIGPVSTVLRWRQVLVPLVALVVLLLVSAVSIGRGDFPIGVTDVVRTLLGLDEGPQEFIVRQLRAPRVVVGLLVGLALGIAGALFQTFARNPLASPTPWASPSAPPSAPWRPSCSAAPARPAPCWAASASRSPR